MAGFYNFVFDNKEFKLKMTTATKIEAEKMLGVSILDALEDMAKAQTFAVILWAALQKYNSNYPMPRVYNLIDELENAGFGLEDKTNCVLEILKVSGFFTQEQAANMDTMMAEMQPTAQTE